MIPRILHQLWLGPAERPALADAWTARWIKMNPEWELCTWRVDVRQDLQGAMLSNEHFGHSIAGEIFELLQQCRRPHQIANILRLHLLERLGGIWIDHDVEPLKPLGGLVDSGEAFASPFRWTPGVNNSFMAAVAGHPWLKRCLDLLRTRDPAVPLSMGSGLVTAALGPDVKLLHPEDILQDISWDSVRSRCSPRPRTIAIHHFASRPPRGSR